MIKSSSVLCALLDCILAQASIPLHQFEWTVSSPDHSISVPGSFPSQAHLDLFRAGEIEDPYYGINYLDQRWVARSNWTYSTALTGIDPDATQTWLLFQGLDTFAGIQLCDQHVASTNNQFRQYYFDVTGIVRKCPQKDPHLSINFGSAPKIVDKIANQPGQETWPYGVELTYEFDHRQFMRKEQNDFGWDWGPAFAPAGPWLPGYVIQMGESGLHVRNAVVDVYREGQVNNRIPDQSRPWMVNCSIDYLGTLPDDVDMRYTLANATGGVVARGSLSNVTSQSGSVAGITSVQDGSVKMWWPNGLGAQHMYNMTIDLSSVGSNSTLASVDKRVGFRTIVVNAEPISDAQIKQGIASGSNWHFEINGHEFFAKGSNFIPPDTFWPRVNETHIRNLFGAVVAANQNMLRVWSSGAYSPDFIYDVADELGILLWSEFEFGDSLYPVDQNFLDNVYEEAVYQVRRVNHHPSLAFWAGGNELENLELASLNETANEKEYTRYKNEYEKLFLTTLFPAVFENTHSISYSPSSTSNGFISLNFDTPPYIQERYESTADNSIYGVTDYYNYDPVPAFDVSTYPVGRFSNEFGYHSMPSLQTWSTALDQQDRHFNSTPILLRNRHYPPQTPDVAGNLTNSTLGMGEMTRAAQLWFPFPTTKKTSSQASPNDSALAVNDNQTNMEALFAAQTHTTQLFQAAFYTNQIAFYRRGAGLPQRNLGALYWQLEDIWQAPSWAGIEHGGRWKVLHHAAGDAFKNVVVHPFLDYQEGGLGVWVMSDLWEGVGGRWDLEAWTWEEERVLGREGNVSVGAINATEVWKGNVTEMLGEKGRDARDVVFRVGVDAKGRTPNTETEQVFKHEAWVSAVPLSKARLVDPGLQLYYNEREKEFVVEATQAVASWVWLDYPSGAVIQFEANGFWMRKGEKRFVGYKVVSDATGGQWWKDVSVGSVWDLTTGTLSSVGVMKEERREREL